MAFKLPLRIFSTPRHQRFEYKPRYWDPDKEERRKRLEHVELLKERGNVESMKARISSGLKRGGRRDATYRAKMVKQANIRLFVVLVSVILISLVLIWIFLPGLISAIMG